MRIRSVGIVLACVLAGWILLSTCAISFAQTENRASTAVASSGSTEGTDKSFSVEAAWSTLKSRFSAGGTTMWAILMASTIGMASLLERIFRLTRRAFVPHGLALKADELWNAGKFADIEALAAQSGNRNSTLAKIIRFVVRRRDADIHVINAAIGDIAGRDFTTHQMFAYPMVAVATICPLFGLMGTVLGIIDTFEMVAIAGAMGDPSIMAAGISKALVCTAFGLVVAIPTLFIYHLVKLRTQYLNRLLEEEASFLVESWLIKGGEGRK